MTYFKHSMKTGAVICVALAIGATAGHLLRAKHEVVAKAGLVQPMVLEVVEPDESEAVGQLVQEPLQRSSFKPPSFRESTVRNANKRGNIWVMRAFGTAIGTSWHAAVSLWVNNEQVALGAIVHSDGWIITKASQLPKQQLQCKLFDKRLLTAKVVQHVVEHDLALLHIEATGLPTVRWESTVPERGAWLATIAPKSMPRSVGVASAGVQRVRAANPVLGVLLEDLPGGSSIKGASVKKVLMGTGAERAGLAEQDTIFEVNGTSVSSTNSFRHAIAGAHGGDLIELGVQRGKSRINVSARLMDLSEELLDETEMEVNGPVSARATDFKQVFLHDTVLSPHECGGPLVNLDGQVVGINIARAGRVTSYALPAGVIKPLVDSLISEARLVSRSAEPALTPVR